MDKLRLGSKIGEISRCFIGEVPVIDVESGEADKVDRIDIDNIIEKLEYSEDFNGEFQHPKSLTELKKALK